MTSRMAVIACGAMTCVGYSAPATCAAVRSKLSGVRLTGFENSTADSAMWAPVPLQPGPNESNVFSRLVALGTAAFDECVNSVESIPDDCPVLLCIREPCRRNPRDAWTGEALLSQIVAASAISGSIISEVIEHGNASVAVALQRAKELMLSRKAEVCIVGGVDSFLNPFDVGQFARAYRVRSSEVAQGFVPGEGAAFLAVTLDKPALSGPIIRGIGFGREDATTSVQSSSYSTGIGLESALRASLEDAGIHESAISFRISDSNGEIYRGLENTLATTRFYRTRREKFPQILPSVSIGEIGAATGALQIAIATTALVRAYAPGPIAMCETASDGGLRAACVVSGGN